MDKIYCRRYSCCNNSNEKSNSILDAIQLFETIAISGKGKLLKEKPIYVLFNKFDKFEKIVLRV